MPNGVTLVDAVNTHTRTETGEKKTVAEGTTTGTDVHAASFSASAAVLIVTAAVVHSVR